jgi:hypothetical protein
VDACSSTAMRAGPGTPASSHADVLGLATGAAGLFARVFPAACAGGADEFVAHPDRPRPAGGKMTQTAAMKLLNAATTTGDGPVFNLEFPQLAAAVQAEIAGAPTQAVIN